jgi:hypothetical protein
MKEEEDILNLEIKFEDKSANDKTERSDLNSERQREIELESKKWIIRHNGNFRMRWDLFVILLTIWNCLSIPFFFAFTTPESVVLEVLDYMIGNKPYITITNIDMLFLFDMIFNFFTTYVNRKTNTEVSERKKIVFNYLFKGRFFIDLLATTPFDLFV